MKAPRTVMPVLNSKERQKNFEEVAIGFNIEDASQIFVGAFALAVPISFSEEAWRLGETLPAVNLLMLFILSVVFLALFTYESVFQRNVKTRPFIFFIFNSLKK